MKKKILWFSYVYLIGLDEILSPDFMTNFVGFLCRMDKIFHIQNEHERSVELLLCNPLTGSHFISHRNITSFLLKKKCHRTYYLNKCRMDIYAAANSMWKWARPKTGLFLSICTIVTTVMCAIFKINPVVPECTCVFNNVHPTYLFYNSQP